MDDVWSDIGYTKESTATRGKWKRLGSIVASPSSDEIKQRFIALGAEILSESGQSVVFKLQHRTIELWIASDCYFLQAKQKYGNGILRLLSSIESHLKRSA